MEFVGHHWDPFGPVDDQRPPPSQRHKGQVHLAGHGIDRHVHVVHLEQRAHLVAVAEHHVHPVGQQAPPLVAVPVHAESVGKAERYRPAGGVGHVHGAADRRLGLLGIPEVTLAIQVRGRGHQVGGDIVRREVGRDPQVCVHSSLRVRGHLNEAPSRGIGAGHPRYVEPDTHVAQVPPEDLTQEVVGHLADVGRPPTERRHADHGVGRRPARLLQPGRHGGVELDGPVGVDERH